MSEQDVEKGPDQPEAGEGEPKPEGAEGAEAEAEEKPAEEEEVLPPSKKTYQQEAAEARLKHTMKEVEQVQNMMRDNVEKMMERDAKLVEMAERSDRLEESGKRFESQAGALKNKAMMANLKATIAMVLVGAACAGIVYLKYFKE